MRKIRAKREKGFTLEVVYNYFRSDATGSIITQLSRTGSKILTNWDKDEKNQRLLTVLGVCTVT